MAAPRCRSLGRCDADQRSSSTQRTDRHGLRYLGSANAVRQRLSGQVIWLAQETNRAHDHRVVRGQLLCLRFRAKVGPSISLDIYKYISLDISGHYYLAVRRSRAQSCELLKEIDDSAAFIRVGGMGFMTIQKLGGAALILLINAGAAHATSVYTIDESLTPSPRVLERHALGRLRLSRTLISHCSTTPLFRRLSDRIFHCRPVSRLSSRWIRPCSGLVL